MTLVALKSRFETKQFSSIKVKNEMGSPCNILLSYTTVVPREVVQNQFFFGFLLIFFIDVSCGHDFLNDANIKVRRSLRIIRACS